MAHIGCSGWHYQSWKGLVYPADLSAGEWLPLYTRWFQTVELNNSFYRLPSEETFAGWRRQVPRGFLFAVKASRPVLPRPPWARRPPARAGDRP